MSLLEETARGFLRYPEDSEDLKVRRHGIASLAGNVGRSRYLHQANMPSKQETRRPVFFFSKKKIFRQGEEEVSIASG